MQVNVDPLDDFAMVARVQVRFADGREEVWMVPMALTDDALSYRAWLYPPEGAVIVRVDPLKRANALAREVVISRAETIEL
jgi:hypothetical protein